MFDSSFTASSFVSHSSTDGVVLVVFTEEVLCGLFCACVIQYGHQDQYHYDCELANPVKKNENIEIYSYNELV
jgi:hypothetical protein